MADISQLNLVEPDPIDWDTYDSGGFPTPPAGRYTGQVPPELTFDETKERLLLAIIDPITIVGPIHQGFTVRFTKESVKKFSNNRSRVGDFLQAVGITAQPRTNDEYAQALEASAGRVFQFYGDWDGYCPKPCEWTIKKMKSFPRNADGTYNPVVKCPRCGEKVQARFRVSRYIPANGDVE